MPCRLDYLEPNNMEMIIEELRPLDSSRFLSNGKIRKGDRGTICYICKKEKEWKNVTWKEVQEKTFKLKWVYNKKWYCKDCANKNNIEFQSEGWTTPDERFFIKVIN